MKKILFSIAVLLLSLPSLSQEADSLKRGGVQFSIIPRLDGMVNIPSDGSNASVGWGNTSIYTLLEANFAEKFSITLSNHWLQSYDLYNSGYQGGLYYRRLEDGSTMGLLHSDWCNLFDVATFAYQPTDNWGFKIGKDLGLVGGFEYDPWDVDVHSVLSSYLWNSYQCYQYGLWITYTTPSGNSDITLGATTSPYGEYFFSSGLFSYGAQWKGSFGGFSTIYSLTAMQADETDKGVWQGILTLGHQYELNDFTFMLDYVYTFGKVDPAANIFPDHSLEASICWAPLEQLDFTLKGGFCNFVQPFYDPSFVGHGGLLINYYPLRDSKDLRLHLLASYNSKSALYETATTNIGLGITYNFQIVPWRKK